MKKAKLICSSSSLEGLQTLAIKYFFSDVLLEDGVVLNSKRTGVHKGFMYEVKRKRYRLLSI
jgi:hypothetical protein